MVGNHVINCFHRHKEIRTDKDNLGVIYLWAMFIALCANIISKILSRAHACAMISIFMFAFDSYVPLGNKNLTYFELCACIHAFM